MGRRATAKHPSAMASMTPTATPFYQVNYTMWERFLPACAGAYERPFLVRQWARDETGRGLTAEGAEDVQRARRRERGEGQRVRGVGRGSTLNLPLGGL